MGVTFYCGINETKWNHHPTAPGEFACIAPVYGKTTRTKRGGLFRDPRRRNDRTLTAEYGKTPGQLAVMRAGALVSSPPYESAIPRDGRGTKLKIHKQLEEKYNKVF